MAELGKGARITGDRRTSVSADLAGRYADGESIRAIAADLGRSYGWVQTLLKEAGVELRGRGGDTRSGRFRSTRAADATEADPVVPAGEGVPVTSAGAGRGDGPAPHGRPDGRGAPAEEPTPGKPAKAPKGGKAAKDRKPPKDKPVDKASGKGKGKSRGKKSGKKS